MFFRVLLVIAALYLFCWGIYHYLATCIEDWRKRKKKP